MITCFSSPRISRKRQWTEKRKVSLIRGIAGNLNRRKRSLKPISKHPFGGALGQCSSTYSQQSEKALQAKKWSSGTGKEFTFLPYESPFSAAKIVLSICFEKRVVLPTRRLGNALLHIIMPGMSFPFWLVGRLGAVQKPYWAFFRNSWWDRTDCNSRRWAMDLILWWIIHSQGRRWCRNRFEITKRRVNIFILQIWVSML